MHSQPIVIIGAPRSGTSILGQLFSAHPDLAYAKEHRLAWMHGNEHLSDILRPKHATHEVKRKIRHHFTTFVQAQNKSRLLEKTPSNALRLGFVNEVFPDAIYIHVIRRGLESVLSIADFWDNKSGGIPKAKLLQRLKEIRPSQAPRYANELLRRLSPVKFGRPIWGPRLPGLNELALSLSTYEIAALQWRCCVESACMFGRQLPADRYIEIRLEKLNENILNNISKFSKLDSSDSILGEYKSRYKIESSNTRSSNADKTTIEKIHRIIEPTQAWLDNHHT